MSPNDAQPPQQLPIRLVNGLPVFDVPADFPVITDEMVCDLLD